MIPKGLHIVIILQLPPRLQKIKKERKQKEAQHKQKISDNRQHLSNIRSVSIFAFLY